VAATVMTHQRSIKVNNKTIKKLTNKTFKTQTKLEQF
jgi:hypothetical protein